jgi:GNS1/SUR4 family
MPNSFAYDRVSPIPLVAHCERPLVVAAMLVLYLCSKGPIKSLGKALKIDAKNEAFLHSVAIHNALLAVFSGVVAYNSWAVVLEHYRARGAWDVYCDPDGSLWKNGLGAWSTIFYLSKYWEFADTWILVLKGKKASFLQVYHHTGIVIAMWAGVVSQSSWLLFVVLLNSVIHTIMYTYFFIKTVWPNQEVYAARYITRAQLCQFYTGIVCSLGYFFLGSDCMSRSSLTALTFLHTYAFGLIALFLSFARTKYKKP